jgi:hypothetical protein
VPESRKARRASGTRNVPDILLLRFLRRSPERDVDDLHRLRNGDATVRPISVTCFLRGHDESSDRSELGHLILDGQNDRFVSRRGNTVFLSSAHVRLRGLAERPSRGVVKKGFFTEVIADSDWGELRLSVPNVDVLLVQAAFTPQS